MTFHKASPRGRSDAAPLASWCCRCSFEVRSSFVRPTFVCPKFVCPKFVRSFVRLFEFAKCVCRHALFNVRLLVCCCSCWCVRRVTACMIRVLFASCCSYVFGSAIGLVLHECRNAHAREKKCLCVCAERCALQFCGQEKSSGRYVTASQNRCGCPLRLFLFCKSVPS